MLNITIEDSLLESNLKQAFGEDTKSIAKAFSEFIQGYKIKQDIKVSIEQLDADGGLPLAEAVADIRSKYEWLSSSSLWSSKTTTQWNSSISLRAEPL